MKMPRSDEQDHALRGAEVAAVDPGEEDADPELDAAVLDYLAAALATTARSAGAAGSPSATASRIRTGTTSSEHRARQREQQHAADDPADERRAAEHQHAPALAPQLAAVADRAADRRRTRCPTVLLTLAMTGE